jgi:hypothetical protein
MRPYLWPLQGILGALLFSAATIGVMLLVLLLLSEMFSARLIPKGAGWLILPLAAGWVGWKVGSTFGIEALLEKASVRLNQVSRLARIWVAGAAVWVAGCVFYLFAAWPYGRYMGDDDYLHFAFVVTGPLLIFGLGIFLFAWALKD